MARGLATHILGFPRKVIGPIWFTETRAAAQLRGFHTAAPEGVNSLNAIGGVAAEPSAELR